MANASAREILMNLNNLPSGTWPEMLGRMLSELKLKLFLTVALNLWFYVPYCLLQRHRLFPPTQMSPSFLDRLIPFSDQAVWAYLSLFLLMPIGPFLMCRRDQLVRYGLGIFLIAAVSYLVFIFWPTWCPRPEVQGTTVAYRVLVSLDNPLHAFPSLHAAFAVFSALCAAQVLREVGIHPLWRAAVGCWALLILLATLFTKQHMLADIVAGSAVGFGVYFCLFSQRIARLKTKTFTQSINGNKMRPSSTTL